MPDFFTPLTSEYSLQIPDDPITLIGWVVWFSLLIILVFRHRDKELKINRQTLIWMALLSVLVLFFTPFFGFSVQKDAAMWFSPFEHFMVFAAVPWLVAAGVIGMLPSVLLAGMSGLLLAYLDTQNIFTPLIFMTAAVIFSCSIRQRYRTALFRFLRFPLFAAIFSLLLTLPFIFVSFILSVPGEMALRIYVAFNQIATPVFTFSGMLLIGGLICVFVRLVVRQDWETNKPLLLAPGETSIKFRLMMTTVPLLLVMLVGLVVSNWAIVENTTKRNLVARLISTSNVVAEGLPVFLETGENLMVEWADDDQLFSESQEDLTHLLSQKMESFTYFQYMAFVNADGKVTISYPPIGTGEMDLSPDEQAVIELIFAGSSPSVVIVPSNVEEWATGLSYFSRVTDSSGQVVSVLWGRTDIAANQLSKLFVSALDDLAKSGGIGQIVDPGGYNLYHTTPQKLMTAYKGSIHTTPTYFEGESSDGQALVQYFQPAGDTGWAVVTSLPMQVIQVTAWRTAYPLLVIGLCAILIVIATALVMLSPVINDIDQMKAAVEKVANRDFDIHPLKSRSRGEMRGLIESFEGMTNSLRSQMQKQSDLMSVSERITGKYELKDSLHAVMTAALARGVSSVRVALINSSAKGLETPYRSFGLGKHAHLFVPLDREILANVKTQGSLVLRDFQVGKMLQMTKGMPYPASLVAMPIEWQDTILGVLWVTFQDRKSPETEDVAFFRALSQKASEAIRNIKAIEDLVTVQAQLESVLNMMTDAVLIIDNQDHVIFHNHNSKNLFGKAAGQISGRRFSDVVDEERLLELVGLAEDALQSAEFQLNDGRIYHLLVSPIRADERKMGKALIIKDITKEKEKESLTSEFVTTVSHELRSPLTLIHGYAKILRLTGNLNEQQDVYISNVIEGVEEMKSLVQNLLDMGRLEAGDSLDITQFGVNEIVQKVVESYDAQAKQKNIKINITLPESLIMIEADATFLSQALKNLVENAIKFTKMGGDIDLKVKLKDESVVFEVHDNGIGIAPLDQRHLFKKFHRINAQTGQDQSGSGLGLAIVKSIADRHGGRVWLESQLGQGSVFYLEIPRKSEI